MEGIPEGSPGSNSYVKIEEELRQCYILKMLIQPIVENSLKHGEVMEREDGYISISIYSDGEDVQRSTWRIMEKG